MLRIYQNHKLFLEKLNFLETKPMVVLHHNHHLRVNDRYPLPVLIIPSFNNYSFQSCTLFVKSPNLKSWMGMGSGPIGQPGPE